MLIYTIHVSLKEKNKIKVSHEDVRMVLQGLGFERLQEGGSVSRERPKRFLPDLNT